ncbi:MAG: NADH-quinone oxidoreductase subunit N, partial [Dehalococcoidales bacterium]|nr:NADH-quinone oxidoreductase subunit N [Dehalococcoidales bacterium]
MNLGLLAPALNLSVFPLWAAILPELILVASAILVILLDLFTERKKVLAAVSIIGIVISAFFSLSLWNFSLSYFNGMFALDSFAVFFKLLFLGIAAMVILASQDYVSRFARFQGEYYALILISALGMTLMAATTELISIYIALELTSIPLYVLVGFLKDQKSTEASLKYLLLGAIASAVLLYGMALVFGFTGETQLGEIGRVLHTMTPAALSASPALFLGIVMMIAGFGFKIAAVPFHMWVPDVYEGAPTPITAYLSVGSKAAGFAVILRVFNSAFGLPAWLSQEWGMVFAVLAAIGMTLGNVTALPQVNIKRMLGYSSIAQAGYLMVGLAAMGVAPGADVIGRSGVIFFLAGYAVANLGAFTAIIAISNKLDSDLIKDYSGVSKRAPLLALALSLSLISLIGMPPAAGFMAKFYIFSGAVHNGLLWLVIIAVINSVISAYYYLRVVKVMWFGEPASAEKIPSSSALRIALLLSSLGVLLLGIVPGYVI